MLLLNCRAMAISMSIMFGRMGCVGGANTIALLLDNNCETSFYLSASILFGKFLMYSCSIHLKIIKINSFVHSNEHNSILHSKYSEEKYGAGSRRNQT